MEAEEILKEPITRKPLSRTLSRPMLAELRMKLVHTLIAIKRELIRATELKEKHYRVYLNASNVVLSLRRKQEDALDRLVETDDLLEKR